MSFNQFNLNTNIYKAIQLSGFTKPTPIQARCIPEIMDRKDIIASAQTGTGKTAAFVLPALHHLSTKTSEKNARILVLAPTRELANQITDVAQKLAKFLRLNIVSVVGGVSYRQQLKNLSRAVDMIIATPGRLLDHMDNHFLDLSAVELLVLDEADRMLDMGFIDDIKQIAANLSTNRQTLLFSATVDDKLASISKKLLKNPIRIDLSRTKITPDKIRQELYMANNPQHKVELLKYILSTNNIYKAIIFSATKRNADKLAKELCHLGYFADALHGDLKQNVRNRIVEKFRHSKIQYLVATDVAARGIDIDDITHIVNFDLPKFHEDYVHRIGRTGRGGKAGTAISFALSNEKRQLQKIERYTNQPLHYVKMNNTLSSTSIPPRNSKDGHAEKRCEGPHHRSHRKGAASPVPARSKRKHTRKKFKKRKSEQH